MTATVRLVPSSLSVRQVGKTELAKQLALDLFGNKDAIIRLDMSEYSDRTAVSKLIGTTAGYVGYDDNSILLPSVSAAILTPLSSWMKLKSRSTSDYPPLQVLDDGHLTDGQGNQVNFKIPLLSRLLMLVLVMECQKLKKIKTSWTASPILPSRIPQPFQRSYRIQALG